MPANEGGAFSEISEIKLEVTPTDYRKGNETIAVRKLHGLTKYANATFKSGITSDIKICVWVLNGEHSWHGDVSIMHLDKNGRTTIRRNFDRD